MGLRVRPAIEGDAAALARLTTQLGYPVGVETLGQRLAPLLGDDRSVILVAVGDDDLPRGWLHVDLHHSLESAPAVRIGGLVVDEGHRSQGIGRELLRAGEAWAREHGVSRMTLYSRQMRERAHRFYEREGYRIVKRSYMFEKDLA